MFLLNPLRTEEDSGKYIQPWLEHFGHRFDRFKPSDRILCIRIIPPSIPPTIRAAIDGINKTQTALIRSWEDLEINGKYIVSEICEAIVDSDFFCADMTGINSNVMFELGYAIATDKRIWLIRDDSYVDACCQSICNAANHGLHFEPYDSRRFSEFSLRRVTQAFCR